MSMCVTTFTTPKLIGVWAAPVSSFTVLLHRCAPLNFCVDALRGPRARVDNPECLRQTASSRAASNQGALSRRNRLLLRE